MAQGDNIAGQKGTKAIFVMMLDEINHDLRHGKNFAYGNPVVDYRPHKDEPKRIWITAGGNIVKYE
jgi:hypothetical protein